MGPSVTKVRVEQGDETAPLSTPTPRISWIVTGVRPSDSVDQAEVEFVSDTGEQVVAQLTEPGGVLAPWPFAPLKSRDGGVVRLRVEAAGVWSDWSRAVRVEVGLLDPADWEARFISASTLGGLDDGAPQLHRSFHLEEKPVKARLYVTARGLYEAWLNHTRVGHDVLTPGWTSYEKRLRYQAYDVLERLVIGENTLSVLLGNGWYRGQLVEPGNRSSYGERLSLLAQLELEFADGRRRTIGTDEQWGAAPTGIVADDLYDGECRDLRVDAAACRERSEGVDVLDDALPELVARRGPAVRATEEIAPWSIETTRSGALQVDFGQNLVGWVRLVVRDGKPGDVVVIRHAEVLERGELAVRPLRSAKARCDYVLAGGEREVLSPTFTFHGFRFAEITGVERHQLEEIRAVVIGSDLERIGTLETSDPRLNRLHENVVWSMRGNFLDLPTDCPQRDERLGWTGDIAVFAPTANYLCDTSGFLADWLEELSAAQAPDGAIPYVIPDVLRVEDPAAAGWGDAAALVPWALYTAFDDVEMLERQYPSMQAWVEKVTSLVTDHLWRGGFQFGDWLDPTAPPEAPASSSADPEVVATAFYANSVRILARVARVLGYEADAARYAALVDDIRSAFDDAYMEGDGRIRSDCQSVYALAICFELLLDESAWEAAGRRLASLVLEADFTIATGFLGTPFVLEALTLTGRADLAYSMLLSTDLPSWLYAVEMGATTVWERWDAMLPDGSVNPGTMTSFNHYAFGAVADWMHRRIGGLTPIAPGWSRVRVEPCFDARLDWARAEHESPYGLIASAWRRLPSGIVEFDLQLPNGVVAEVRLAGSASPRVVSSGSHRFEVENTAAGRSPSEDAAMS